MEIFAFNVGGGPNGSQQYLIGIKSIVYNYNLPILFRSGFQFDVTVQCTTAVIHIKETMSNPRIS